MNQIKITTYAEISSHIDESAISILENTKWRIEWIQLSYTRDEETGRAKVFQNENDFAILNRYFQNNKQTTLRWMENWWIPMLPNLERFAFTANAVNEETVNLLQNSKVKSLWLEHSPDKKYDLQNLLVFKNTLEELLIEGKYSNLELLINETKELKRLGLTSINIDFNKLDENSIDDFYYYGSKVKDWTGIIKLKKLKKLKIKTSNSLDNLDFLKELKNLEIIELPYCSNIKTFPDLSGLKNLKSITAFDCNKLENIDELRKLKNVRIHVNGKMLPDKYYCTDDNTE
jgi:hypothetical protein